jgi:hypothetical protein
MDASSSSMDAGSSITCKAATAKHCTQAQQGEQIKDSPWRGMAAKTGGLPRTYTFFCLGPNYFHHFPVSALLSLLVSKGLLKKHIKVCFVNTDHTLICFIASVASP